MLNLPRLMFRVLIFLLSAGLALTLGFSVKSQTTALTLALEAQQLYKVGNLNQAAIIWQEAASTFATEGDVQGRTKSLINQSQVLQDLGQYPRACDALLAAFDLENSDCTQIEQLDRFIQQFTDRNSHKNSITTVEGIGLRSLGNILLHQGKLGRSQKLLDLSVTATKGSPELSQSLLALGNIHQALGNQTRDRWSYDQITEVIDRQLPENAIEPYLPAVKAYEAVDLTKSEEAPSFHGGVSLTPSALPITQVQAQLNYLALLIETESWWQQQTNRRKQSWQRLHQTSLIEAADNFSALLTARLSDRRIPLQTKIADSLAQLPPSHQGIYAHINYAKSLTTLGQREKVESILQTARQQAKTIGDRRGLSYALGYLGQYYGQTGQLSQGITLTNQALAISENLAGDAREISYLWQSQLGQLLEQEGIVDGAIAAYTSAFNNLQSLRTDLNANNQVIQFNFRQEVKPVYLRLANLLLDHNNLQAAKSLTALDTFATVSNNNQLELARQVIESLQLAELDNFFQDPCSKTADVTVTIDDLDPQAAVIYPIVLGDRLEVILSMAGKPLQRFTTNVAADTINRTLDSVYDSLYNQSIDNSAVNIFSTTPLNPREVTENTEALLSSLKQIYGWLIEPLEAELTSKQIKTLVFVPNGKLQNLPLAALYDGKQYLLEKYSVALVPSLQLLNPKPSPRTKLKVLAAGLSQQVEIKGEIFPALVNVPQELKQIEQIFPESYRLLNQDFTVKNIKQQLEKGYPVVHLATHGLFSSDPQQTFIVTGDRQIINLDALSKILGSNSTSRPELIVLSACDTATGDDRAVLGLAGVAVRSGSSTIASLWSVDDISTSKLMTKFYRELENPDNKKVDALRAAQLSLIESLRANPTVPELPQLPPHPYYWSSYVLVGNWQ
jgi:CHAT domain-containing protein